MYHFYNSLKDLNRSIFFKSKKCENSLKEIYVKNHDSLIDFLKKTYPKQNFNLPISQVTRDFHSTFLKNFLSNFCFNNKSFENINKIRKVLTELKNKNLIAVEADKNIGITLIETNIYNSLALDHLNEKNFYSKIDQDPSSLVLKESQDLIKKLNKSNHISEQLALIILKNLKDKKLPRFRLLPKLHKTKFGIRPIINCSKTTLEVISKTIDFYMKPLAAQHFTCLKDSQNLIQLTEKLIFTEKSKLFTADFESLYSNIPLEKAIEVISEMMSKNSFDHFTAFGFHSLLKLVLKNNFFLFKTGKDSLFYLQIKGVAMGTACGPSVANLYLAYFEIKYLSLLNTSLYFRFIDDLFFISDNLLENSHFESIYPDLKLNISSSKTVNFLDLNINLNYNSKLEFDLYIKPTNTFSYLLYSSNHPSFIFKNIPKSLIFRIRRICSRIEDFYYHTSILHKNLILRNFESRKILNLIRAFSQIDRDLLIPYKEKKKFSSNFISFNFYFEKSFLDFNKFVKETWLNILPSNSVLKHFQFYSFFKIQPNLNSYLVNRIKFPFSSFSYLKCLKNCKTCRHSNSNFILENKFNLPIFIPQKTTCTSKNCIYILNCKKCNVFYVGETSRSFKTRFSEHYYRINYLKNYYNDETKINKFNINNVNCKLLYNHFAQNHVLEDDLRFQIFGCDFISLRKRLESDLIFVLNTLQPNGLNSSTSFLLNCIDNYQKPPLISVNSVN